MGSWGFGPLDNDDAQDWLVNLKLGDKIERLVRRFLRLAEADAKHNAKRRPGGALRLGRADYIVDEVVAALYLASLTSNDLLGGGYRVGAKDVVRIFNFIHEIDQRRNWRDPRARLREMRKLKRRLLHHEGLMLLAKTNQRQGTK